MDGGGEDLVGGAAVGVGAGEDGGGGGGLGVGGVAVGGFLVEVVDGAAVAGDESFEVPVAAQDGFEQQVAGAGGFAVDGVVGAHDGAGLGVDDGVAEGGEVGIPEVVGGGVDVEAMALALLGPEWTAKCLGVAMAR